MNFTRWKWTFNRAWKELDSTAAATVREIRTMSQLNHPGVVKFASSWFESPTAVGIFHKSIYSNDIRRNEIFDTIQYKNYQYHFMGLDLFAWFRVYDIFRCLRFSTRKKEKEFLREGHAVLYCWKGRWYFRRVLRRMVALRWKRRSRGIHPTEYWYFLICAPPFLYMPLQMREPRIIQMVYIQMEVCTFPNIVK